ncbi:MAG: hypothetical protein ACTSVB_10720 [Candidatus Heimdallarchaeaceae archaeon]
MKDEIYKLLPDTVTPTITDFQYTIIGENLSVYSPELRVFTNITEDREVSNAELILSGGSDSETTCLLTPKREGDFFIINETVSIDVTFLYSQDEISAKLVVCDFKENEDVSSVLTIPVTHYNDSSAPKIVKTDIEVSEVSDKFQIDVSVVIQEDLFLVSANATILKNYKRWYPKPLMQVNTTFWETSFTLSKTMAHLCELNLTIEVKDVASNFVNNTLPVPTDLDPSGCEVEEPTVSTDPTESTEPTKTPISTLITLITLITLASVYYNFKKK